jgi:methylaspartate mutase epsilon subunit
MIASIVEADKIVVKTVDEALGVPMAKINAEAVDMAGYVTRVFGSAGYLDSPLIERETNLIESECRAILDAIFELPGISFWESVFRAFQYGWIDVPFSPHADNANRLVSMRDLNNSIRIADPGSVPINDEDRSLEQELLSKRDGRDEKTYRQLLADINLMV